MMFYTSVNWFLLLHSMGVQLVRERDKCIYVRMYVHMCACCITSFPSICILAFLESFFPNSMSCCVFSVVSARPLSKSKYLETGAAEAGAL